MKEVYVVDAARSPIFSVAVGKNDAPNTSSVSKFLPEDIAVQVLAHLFSKSRVAPEEIGFFYLGSAISQKVERSLYQNPAKYVIRKGAQGRRVRALGRNVEKACSTGLLAVWSAARKILVGKADVALAGGMDFMSRQPNSVILAGLTDPNTGKFMAELADMTAEKLGLTREMHDAFALDSCRWAVQHLGDQEITPISVGDATVTQDEEVVKKAARITEAHLRKTPSYPGCKIITPFNSSKFGDAVAFLLLASEKAVKERNLTPIARIAAFAEFSYEEPQDFIIAPAGAAKKALEFAGLASHEIDFWENNEAFATSPLWLMKTFEIPRERINSWGGAIAHGHPIGATGAVLSTKHIQILRKEGKRYGMVVICNAISEATAMIFEKL